MLEAGESHASARSARVRTDTCTGINIPSKCAGLLTSKRRLTANIVARSRLTTGSPFDKSSRMLKFTMTYDSKAALEVKNVFVGPATSCLEDDKPSQDEVRVFLESFSDGSAAVQARSWVKRLCAKQGWNEADCMPGAQLKNKPGLAGKSSVLAPKAVATKKYHP